MCGIHGNNRSLPFAMATAMVHRGPHHTQQCLIDDNWTFGHNRLSVIDPSEAGHQPMKRGNLWITYNGEIYNFKELRDALGPEETWRSETDTEVLLEYWRRYGPGCLPMFDGMFAFAIWDSDKKLLTLVRDRAGEKPLYWTFQNGVFAFASELKALTRVPGLEWMVDRAAFDEYMALRYVPAPRSIIQNVQKLEPGHYLTFDGKNIIDRRWYSWEVRPQPEESVSQRGFNDAVDATEAALIDSIKHRLISDRPLGMFLSGGIDSSLTCAIAAKRLNVTPKTFSIGFADDPKSEHETARNTARLLGCEHSEHIFSTEDFEHVAADIGSRMDEPNGDRSCVPTYLLCQSAAVSVTVALSGDGGDELFGGYGRYFSSCGGSRDYYDRLLPVAGVDWAPWQAEQAAPLFTHPGRDSIHALRQLDFNRYLTCVLAKMDRMSMQHSLEVRTPYLSPAILDIARTLPTGYLKQGYTDKLGKTGKLVLRELVARYVSSELAALPKRGFGMPESVFEANGKMVQEQYRAAMEMPLVKELIGDNPFAKNINSIWAIIVFAQWVRGFGVKL